MLKLTLKEFLELNNGNDVRVTVKEPNKCMTYSTTLKNGKPNMHTNGKELGRKVYSIDVIGGVLSVHVW